jgi:ABC-type transport system substrate-binding protein
VTWNARQRDRLDDQAQQILADDTASIPLYIPHRVVYIRPSVENLYVTGYGVIPRLGSWAQVQFQTVPASAHRVF